MKLRSILATIVFTSIVTTFGAPSAFAQVEWQVQSTTCVLPGASGTWDSGGHTLGDVVFDGTTYHMYLLGGQGTNVLDHPWRIGHWTSTNKIDWDEDPANPVLEPGTPPEWDGFGIINIAVRYDGTMFHLWYSATADYHGQVNVGYATNQDGWGAWDKQSGPLAGLEPGDPGPWCDFGVTPGSILFDGTDYGLWYTASADSTWGSWSIGYAHSQDGLSWTPHPDPVLVGTEIWEGDQLYFPEVVPMGSGFWMWYTSLVPGLARVGFAASPDGVTWAKWRDNPVLRPTLPCQGIEALEVIVEGDTIYGWAAHCRDIYCLTSPLDLVFFDTFENGDTAMWGNTVD